MGRCGRCCLRDSMRVVNVVMLLFGVGMIVYSLWLQKKWNDGVSELYNASSVPSPWFIYTCIGVGIAVCLSTLSGHMVANCISNSTLCIYLVTLTCLLLLEVAIIVVILFKIDWAMKIAAYIDVGHQDFKNFVAFHVKMCRKLVLLVLVAQVTVDLLGIVLWGVGTEQRTHAQCFEPVTIQNFSHSFLVPSSPQPLIGSASSCVRCVSLSELPRRRSSFLSLIKGILADRFRRRGTSVS